MAKSSKGKLTKAEEALLDFSDKGSVEETNKYGAAPETGSNYIDEFEEEEEEEDQASSGIFSFFQKLTGNKTLTEEDLEPVILQIRDNLVGKNVAHDIATKLCESVSTSLQGKKLGSFTTIKSTVRKALEAAITRVLTPNRSTDILPDILAANEKNRPYSIVMVGVNGVGKSTSLAKLCAYFKSQNLGVSIVACDTFRAGAIEQLRTHARSLECHLFEKGYGKDDASVAKEGIRQARVEGSNVVLVDTAGRMQGNSSLMRSLAKLVAINNPDLVLFVGEALVGNDGVDQLVEFNRAMIDYSFNRHNPKTIDGIVLTKFDTIDDKVGAAISMTYSTGIPIMFVGTGQTYRDLRKLNVKMITSSLLK